MDSYAPITAQQAQTLKKLGAEGVIRYLGTVDKQELNGILDSGLGIMFVTVANAFNGKAAVIQIQALGLPDGHTVWLDIEGKGLFNKYKDNMSELIGLVNAWAREIKSIRCIPGGYFGSPQPFTSKEMWQLAVQRYWKGMGMCNDRNQGLTEPAYVVNGRIIGSGWCMDQKSPSQSYGGCWVDFNMVGQDYLGRVPTAVYK